MGDVWARWLGGVDGGAQDPSLRCCSSCPTVWGVVAILFILLTIFLLFIVYMV
jgi:hypothetical protein